MKVRDLGVDDLLNEVRFTLEDDGGRLARLLLRVYQWCCRRLRAAMLRTLRRQWRTGALETCGGQG